MMPLSNARIQTIAARIAKSDLAAKLLKDVNPADMGTIFGCSASKKAAKLNACVSWFNVKIAFLPAYTSR